MELVQGPPNERLVMRAIANSIPITPLSTGSACFVHVTLGGMSWLQLGDEAWLKPPWLHLSPPGSAWAAKPHYSSNYMLMQWWSEKTPMISTMYGVGAVVYHVSVWRELCPTPLNSITSSLQHHKDDYKKQGHKNAAGWAHRLSALP